MGYKNAPTFVYFLCLPRSMHGDRLGWGIKGCEIFMLSFREKINKVKTLATKSLDERKILHLLMSREKVRIMHVTTLKFPFFMDGWQLFIRELNNELPCVSKEKKLLKKKKKNASRTSRLQLHLFHGKYLS